MDKIDLVFVCPEFGSQDYLPSKREMTKISDVNDWLWEIYGKKIAEYAKENLSNLELKEGRPEKERMPLTFDIMILDGSTNQVLPHTANLLDIAEKTDQVFWHPLVTGGFTSSLKFSNHAKYIIDCKKYGWKAIDGNPGSGIMAVGPDKNGMIRTWKILPSQDYPNTPPIVFAEPEFTDDICFQTGQLNFVNFKNGTESIWSYLTKKYFNPLEILLNELLNKYQIGV